MQHILIIGCGDIGRRTALLWQARGAHVTALARTGAGAAVLHQAGIAAVPGDLDQPATLRALPCAGSLLYYFAPPPGQGDTDPRMRAWVATLRELPADRGPARVVYISTTGVYGDCQGAWVNEDTPARPDAARSRRRLDAENTLRVYGRERGVPVSILRVPGIYGPGRLPVDAIHARRPVLDEKECGYTNRIHAEDLAHVCLIAGQRGQADRVYNVSDGQPDSITHYYNCVADALGVPRPPVIGRDQAAQVFSAAMLTYLNESRRVDNRRMREELGVVLRYPTLAAGLAASLAAMNDPAPDAGVLDGVQ